MRWYNFIYIFKNNYWPGIGFLWHRLLRRTLVLLGSNAAFTEAEIDGAYVGKKQEASCNGYHLFVFLKTGFIIN